MRAKLRRVNEQVIVITGASSGIGLVTAQMAAKMGARVVLSSRDEVDLEQAVERIRADGGAATYVAGDVADPEAMKLVAATAIREFGTIDTWINNAGVSIYGRIEEVEIGDARRLFETNYWGVVHGTLAALPHLKGHGGALINVGSVLSDTGYPLQGHYAASKHAVKGFTDSLRIELESEGAPISVTLIQPAAIDTPYPEHAKTYLGVEPTHQPPVYAPEVVARAILHSAEHPERNVLVGGGAKVFNTVERFAPRLGDRFKEATSIEAQRSDNPPRGGDTLFGPRPGDGRARGRYEGHVMQTSAYTGARLHRGQTLLGLAIAGAAVALLDRAGVFGDGD
ncbi:MAG TPA: SDR family oxidoreductase [Gemmatimonadales bacterium]|nr:SDR family oxidoreductase [Gemmatimonadales bacterium]